MVETEAEVVEMSGANTHVLPRRLRSLFRGYGEYAIDEKGRLTLPFPMRAPLVDGGNIVVLDGLTLIFSEETYQYAVDVLDDLVAAGKLARQQVRLFLTGTHQVMPDAQGRIVVPPRIRSQAGLERDVVVCGAGPRIEVWPAAQYQLEVALTQDESVTDALDRANF